MKVLSAIFIIGTAFTAWISVSFMDAYVFHEKHEVFNAALSVWIALSMMRMSEREP